MVLVLVLLTVIDGSLLREGREAFGAAIGGVNEMGDAALRRARNAGTQLSCSRQGIAYRRGVEARRRIQEPNPTILEYFYRAKIQAKNWARCNKVIRWIKEKLN